jgi:hypothetical protein
MNSNLIVDDPLAAQEVTILITLTASERPREERLTLVSVGVAEQPPVLKTGLFSQVSALINEAWAAFGVQAQMAEVAAATATVTEEQVVATATMDDEEAPVAPPLQPTAPKPQAQNLSLF